jgi:hypothetical protein
VDLPEVLEPEVVTSLLVRVVLVDCLTVPPLDVLLPADVLTPERDPSLA